MMKRTNSVNAVLSLPLLMLLWQGSSCHSSKSNVMNNSRAENINGATQSSGVRGMWGGLHITMEVTDTGAEIDYDCAHGRITEKIVTDRGGNFEVKGVHVREHPGPVREGEDNEQAASYRGSIHGDTMTLTVTLAEKNEVIGTFTLTHGSGGRVRKCK